MKKLYLNAGGFDAVFNDLKDSFNGELSANNNEYNLDIKSKWTKGSIKGNRFDDTILFMHFDLVFNQDVSLSIELFQSAPVFFVYCESGNITHTFGANGEKKCLTKQQSAVLNNSSVTNSVLYFESHKHLRFTILGMPTTDVNGCKIGGLASEVKRRFTNDSGNYIYVGKENVKISEKLHEFKTTSQKGIVGNLLQKNILKDVLELEVAQHSYNYLNTFDPIVDLVNKQINELRRISKLSISETIAELRLIARNYFLRIVKARHYLSFKLYNQKLAS